MNKREYSKETQRKIDMIKWKRKRRTVTKDDLLWLFALKDGAVKQHYHQHYGVYDEEGPSESTLVSILSPVFERIDDWTHMIRCLKMDEHLSLMFRKKEALSLSEWLYIAMRNWAIRMDIYWIYEHFDDEWHDWVDEAREDWKNIKEAEQDMPFDEYRRYCWNYNNNKEQ